jgi:hypothetical protein
MILNQFYLPSTMTTYLTKIQPSVTLQSSLSARWVISAFLSILYILPINFALGQNKFLISYACWSSTGFQSVMHGNIQQITQAQVQSIIQHVFV